MNRRELKTKLLVDKYLIPLVVLLLILAAAGAYVTYIAYIEPGTEIEEFEESSWSSSAEYTHEAEVLQPTTVFAQGDVLQNRQSYFEAISPILNSSLDYEYSATAGGNLDVEVEHTLVKRSTDGDGFEYWRLDEPLASDSENAVGPGESVQAPYTMNVSEVREEIDRIDDELGGTPGDTQMLIESQVFVSGERNDQEIQESYTYEKEIEADGSVYSVESEGPFTESGETTGQREVEATYGPLETIGAPALLALSLLGAIALAVGRWKELFDVSEREQAWLAHASVHEEFEEWISTGAVPDEAIPGSRVSVETLEGLVDIAIDSNRRVVQDVSRGKYLVLLESVAYTYDIPREARESGPLGFAPAGEVEGTDALDDGSGEEPDALEDETEEEFDADTSEAGPESGADGEGEETTADGDGAESTPEDQETTADDD